MDCRANLLVLLYVDAMSQKTILNKNRKFKLEHRCIIIIDICWGKEDVHMKMAVSVVSYRLD